MGKFAHDLRGLKLVQFKVYQRGHGEAKTLSQYIFFFNITDNASNMAHYMWFLEGIDAKEELDHDYGLLKYEGKSRYGTVVADGTGSNPNQITNAMPLSEFSQAKARMAATLRDKNVVHVILDVVLKKDSKRLIFEMRGGGEEGSWFDPPLNGKIVADSKVKVAGQNLWKMSKMWEKDTSF